MKITKQNLRRLIKEALLNESMSRYASIWLASNGKWYLDLASNEYGDYHDATTYGPFSSEDAGDSYLRDNFSNPGGLEVDDQGTEDPPTRSPNGSPVQKAGRSGGRSSFSGGYASPFGRSRW